MGNSLNGIAIQADVQLVTALPTPSIIWRGRRVRLQGAGPDGDDVEFVCMMMGDTNYTWVMDVRGGAS